MTNERNTDERFVESEWSTSPRIQARWSVGRCRGRCRNQNSKSKCDVLFQGDETGDDVSSPQYAPTIGNGNPPASRKQNATLHSMPSPGDGIFTSGTRMRMCASWLAEETFFLHDERISPDREKRGRNSEGITRPHHHTHSHTHTQHEFSWSYFPCSHDFLLQKGQVCGVFVDATHVTNNQK